MDLDLVVVAVDSEMIGFGLSSYCAAAVATMDMMAAMMVAVVVAVDSVILGSGSSSYYAAAVATMVADRLAEVHVAANS